MFELNDLMNMLDGEDFEERPVDIEEFVSSPQYLDLAAQGVTLSEYQYRLIKVSSQIYKKSTLINLYGDVEGNRRWKETKKEIIFQLGKGSGKDFTSTIACAYLVYLLLCLKDPARYYEKPAGDSIDILNIAINATQAQNVFFKGFATRIERSPWFENKYVKRQGHFEFDKQINVYSGHSEREAWEGYNVMFVVLDEISGFALESTSGHEGAKTAAAVYEMYRASVTSRFPDYGKLVLLSWPRFRNDFIQQRYNKAIRSKEVILRTHTFKLDPDLPDGTEGNEFDIQWEEDHIIEYDSPDMFALKRPSWEVNPKRSIEDYTRDFYDNPVEALSRYACMPPDAIDAFFKDREKITRAFSGSNGVDATGAFTPTFYPKPDADYYVHVDLARKHDHCAVAMAHVEKWEQRKIGPTLTEPAPVIKVDAIRWWTPTSDKNVDFTEVREYIVSLRRRGFNIKLVTFDRWESYDMMEYLNGVGMKADRLSVAKKHYEDMAMVVHEERLHGPETWTSDKNNNKINLVVEELVSLRIMPNDKIDHPRTGSKDLADATCGAIYNAVSHTPRRMNEEIEVMTLSSVRKMDMIEQAQRYSERGQIIQAPKREMPAELEEYFAGLTAI